MNLFADLPTFAPETGLLHIVIETPKGSRNKFAYDEKRALFQLKGVLPEGSSFPFDFGFVPQTKGGDGDPLDVLLLMDAPAFAGCLVEARLLGVLEADQTDADGHTERNDRLIAVAHTARLHGDLHALTDLPRQLIDEIEHFFRSYNEAKGGRFVVVRHGGPDRARQVVEKARRAVAD